MLISTLAFLAVQATTQHIACFPADDAHSTERLVLSFRFASSGAEPSDGTFYLTSGIDDDGNQETTVKLSLHSAEDSRTPNGIARFAATEDAGTYTIDLREDDLGKATKSLGVQVEFERAQDRASFTEDYECYASTFEDEGRSVTRK